MKRKMLLGTCVLFALLGLTTLSAANKDLTALWENAVFQEKTAGNYAKAITDYERVLKHPKATAELKARATLRLAICRMMINDLDSAVAAFSRVFKDHPELAKGYLQELKRLAPPADSNGTLKSTVTKRKSEAQMKLESIVVEKVAFEETPVTTVFDYLANRSRVLDPKGVGVNFLVFIRPPSADNTDPNSKPLHQHAGDWSEPRITMALDKVPIYDAVRYVCEQADLRYVFDDYVVGILDKSTVAAWKTAAAAKEKAAMDASNLAIAEKLRRTSVDVEFEDISVAEALEFLKHRSRTLEPRNVIVNFVLTSATRKKLPTVTMSVDKIPLGMALHYICMQAGLQYKIEKYAVRIF